MMKKRSSTLLTSKLSSQKRYKRADDVIDLTGDSSDDGDDDDDSVVLVAQENSRSNERARIPIRTKDAGRNLQRPGSFISSSESSSCDENSNNFKLHPKQQEAIDLVNQGMNIFLTGPGGTGKSLVLRRIIEHLSNKYANDEWAAVASTGIAAVPIGGQTLHRFSGCGVPTVKGDFEKCWGKRDQWRALKVLIVEEISMLSGEFLDNLSDVVRRIRGEEEEEEEEEEGGGNAFGGIQLILCGDFLQLPPISKSSREIQYMSFRSGCSSRDIQGNRGFAFQSKVWKQADLKVVELEHIFRQNDSNFQSVLAEIRRGVVSAGGKKFLQKCNRPLPKTSSGIKPTILYAKNKDVTAENLQELRKISGPEHQFQARDSVRVGDGDDSDDDYPQYENYHAENQLWRNKFFNDCIAEKELRLKVNAQVMLIKNEQEQHDFSSSSRSDRGERVKPLTNGSRGVVIGFTKRKASGNKYGDDDLSVDSFESSYMDMDDGGQESDEDGCFPIVRFKCGRTKVIKFELFSSKVPGIGECRREAIPLKLAWAVTIHKSQGMTLDYVKVDVSGVFTDAQTYVALSRATDEKGLQLIGFSASKVKADKRAVAFYENPNGDFPLWS